MVDWIHQRNKSHPNASMQWRALAHAFPVIGRSLAWKFENGAQVRIGSDVVLFPIDLLVH